MGNAISHATKRIRRILEVFNSDKELDLTIIGLDAAGKSTLISLFKHDNELIKPTLGYSIEQINVHNKKLKVFDLGGQAGIKKFWDKYVTNINGLIFMIDIADSNRYGEAYNSLYSISSDVKDGIPILFLLNKSDLINNDQELNNRVNEVVNKFQIKNDEIELKDKKFMTKVVVCSVKNEQEKSKGGRMNDVEESDIGNAFKWIIKIGENNSPMVSEVFK
ncbi:ARF [Hepatospora eriocheir]|uniref:ARF n=1 Tax=Hepatospora eriocheir TaxID=1081669 RepID=A0A1X0QJD0_9MICR|nr:ARF [Hepatospora eriocheir]ORD99879.1 ARF [Hepatospora eriocheir]